MTQTADGGPDKPTQEEVDRMTQLSELHPDDRQARFGPTSTATHRMLQQHHLDRGKEPE